MGGISDLQNLGRKTRFCIGFFFFFFKKNWGCFCSFIDLKKRFRPKNIYTYNYINIFLKEKISRDHKFIHSIREIKKQPTSATLPLSCPFVNNITALKKPSSPIQVLLNYRTLLVCLIFVFMRGKGGGY